MEKAFEATELRAHRQDDLGKRIEAIAADALSEVAAMNAAIPKASK
jgi:hypothetical protein